VCSNVVVSILVRRRYYVCTHVVVAQEALCMHWCGRVTRGTMFALIFWCLYARGPTTVDLRHHVCSNAVVSTLVQTQDALCVVSVCKGSYHSILEALYVQYCCRVNISANTGGTMCALMLSWHRRPYVCTDVVVSHDAPCLHSFCGVCMQGVLPQYTCGTVCAVMLSCQH